MSEQIRELDEPSGYDQTPYLIRRLESLVNWAGKLITRASHNFPISANIPRSDLQNIDIVLFAEKIISEYETSELISGSEKYLS
jgi:hypothetical protein